MQAAVLAVKLQYLDAWNARRQAIAARYQTAFVDLPFAVTTIRNGANPVWHLFVIATPQREALQQHLTQSGVQTLIHYPLPPHLQKAYQTLDMAQGQYPVAEQYAKQVLSLPIGPQLSDADVEHTIDAVGAFFN
ncbi:MAG: hypothetical protein B7Y32_04290 [Methylophilales bacterium 16-45-7]|nr:MAG: hypothetical protein B7Y32_04290 [Methylophilales bacterium 16-45-7]